MVLLLLCFITIIDALSSNHFQTPTLICCVFKIFAKRRDNGYWAMSAGICQGLWVSRALTIKYGGFLQWGYP